MADERSSEVLDLAAYSTHQKSLVCEYLGIKKNSNGIAQRDKCITCKICTQKVTHGGGGTTNLKNHLRTNHRAEYEELFENEQITSQTSKDGFV